MDKHSEISFDDYDELINPRPDENDFDKVLEIALTRRGLLKSVLAVGSVASLGSMAAIAPGEAIAASDRFAFDAIDTNTLDNITLPEGFSSQVVARWGDPLWSDGAEVDHATRGTADSQSVAFGDNIDGMEVFAHGDKTLLVVNNEYTNRQLIWADQGDNETQSDDDIIKGKMAHGLTVVEICLLYTSPSPRDRG